MKKKLFFIFLIALLISATALSYYIFFYDITEKRYNKIMCYYITREVTAGSGDFYGKITVLRNFVNESVLPINPRQARLDTCAIEKLISGIGWCDQQARIFMQLARSIGISSRLLFLKDNSGSSPHSVAEVLAPDKRWVIVDSAFKLDLRNKNGNFATQSDIKEDIGIIRDNERVKLRAGFEEAWREPAFLSIYSNPPAYVTTKMVTAIDYLKFVPTRLIKPIVAVISRRYLNRIKPDIKNPFEFEMIKARTYHLLGYYEKSAKLYNDVIRNSGDLPLVRKARYFNAILIKDRGRYRDAYDYITGVLEKDMDNPYRKFLIGLRAQILEKVGRPREAEEDLKKVKYDLEV
ncbi:MAG: transglutaminase-like domain-containing protein [Candidatus Omnitrophota bacterium]